MKNNFKIVERIEIDMPIDIGDGDIKMRKSIFFTKKEFDELFKLMKKYKNENDK